MSSTLAKSQFTTEEKSCIRRINFFGFVLGLRAIQTDQIKSRVQRPLHGFGGRDYFWEKLGTIVTSLFDGLFDLASKRLCV